MQIFHYFLCRLRMHYFFMYFMIKTQYQIFYDYVSKRRDNSRTHHSPEQKFVFHTLQMQISSLITNDFFLYIMESSRVEFHRQIYNVSILMLQRILEYNLIPLKYSRRVFFCLKGVIEHIQVVSYVAMDMLQETLQQSGRKVTMIVAFSCGTCYYRS